MYSNLPTIKIGRPSNAHTDWGMTLASGLIMGGVSIYELWPTSWDEFFLLIPVVLVIAAVLSTNFLRYTYGEIGPSGLLYRRPWGWRAVPWDKIARIDLDPEIEDVILIRLRRGNRWTRQLRFQEKTLLSDPSTTLTRPELIEHYKALCASQGDKIIG